MSIDRGGVILEPGASRPESLRQAVQGRAPLHASAGPRPEDGQRYAHALGRPPANEIAAPYMVRPYLYALRKARGDGPDPLLPLRSSRGGRLKIDQHPDFAAELVAGLRVEHVGDRVDVAQCCGPRKRLTVPEHDAGDPEQKDGLADVRNREFAGLVMGAAGFEPATSRV
jgi:hypothetical protein